MIGTPAYMAPEQAAGDPATDHRADIYSLGILGYEMLCGAPPFQGRSPHQLMAAQFAGTPEPIERRRAEVPAELRVLIMQCLAKEPDARPRTATGVVRVLERPDIGSGAFSASKPTARRRPGQRIGWAAIILVCAASLTYAFWPGLPSRAEPVSPVATLLVPVFRSAPGNRADAALARAMAEHISASLSQDPRIRVAGPPIGDSLVQSLPPSGGPTLTLDGLFQRAGSETRVTIRLLDQAGFTIWGNTFRLAEANPLVMQDRLGTAILSELVPRLRTTPRISGRQEPSP